MTRTQIYLPEETHDLLLRLAKQEKTTLSKLIREGANEVVKKRSGKKSPQQKALELLTSYPNRLRIKLPKPAHALIREERDDRG